MKKSTYLGIFMKYWWIFPFLLTLSPILSLISKQVFYTVDWAAKVPMLIIYILVFLLTFIALLVSWITLLKNKQWWKFFFSLLATILILLAIW